MDFKAMFKFGCSQVHSVQQKQPERAGGEKSRGKLDREQGG